LTDQVWLELATILIAKGNRVMPVTCEYPDWWVSSLSLGGYGSHVNAAKASQIFTNHLIWIVKEEADSSQTNQGYNQLKDKLNKAMMRPLIDLVAKYFE
jgi:hypothetical protein